VDLFILQFKNSMWSGRLGIINLLVLNIVNDVLSVFNVILLAVNQELSSIIIVLPIKISSSEFLQWKKTLVSSANILNLPKGQQLGRSFIKIRKSKGPRTEPCGTPHEIGLV
ncbi:unnamed protein product, partial [Meganyctiphanes norvegica]